MKLRTFWSVGACRGCPLDPPLSSHCKFFYLMYLATFLPIILIIHKHYNTQKHLQWIKNSFIWLSSENFQYQNGCSTHSPLCGSVEENGFDSHTCAFTFDTKNRFHGNNLMCSHSTFASKMKNGYRTNSLYLRLRHHWCNVYPEHQRTCCANAAMTLAEIFNTPVATPFWSDSHGFNQISMVSCSVLRWRWHSV